MLCIKSHWLSDIFMAGAILEMGVRRGNWSKAEPRWDRTEATTPDVLFLESKEELDREISRFCDA